MRKRLIFAASLTLVAGFALMFLAVFVASLPPDAARIEAAPTAAADAPDPRLIPAEAFEMRAPDAPFGVGSAFVLHRLPTLDDPENWAVLINQPGTNAAIWCGAGFINLDGRLYEGHTRRFMSPLYQRLTAACAEPFLIVSNFPKTDAKSADHVYLAEADSLYDIFVWRRILMEDLPRISTGVGALILILALLYYRTLAFGEILPYFIGLIGAALAYNLHIVWVIDAFQDWARWTIGYPVASLFIGAAAAFSGAWTGDRPARRRGFFLAGLGFSASAFMLFLIFESAALDLVIQSLRIFQIAATGYALWRFAVFARHAPASRMWEVALFFASIGLFTFDLFMNITDLRSYLSTVFPIFIFVIIIAAAASRSAEAFEAMAKVNAVMDRKVQEMEAALDAEFADRRTREREEAMMDERRRIMTDMHDGIGARLLGLATKAATTPGASTLTPEIHGAIDELRLIVNALDSVGDSLPHALAGFRQTVEPKLAAAGLALEWGVAPDAPNPALPPGGVLHLYRLLQEAAANALRHAHATRLRIALRSEDGRAVLTAGDDGVGFSEFRGEGKGLANMADRARRIGAAFSAGRSDLGGAEIRLEFGAA